MWFTRIIQLFYTVRSFTLWEYRTIRNIWRSMQRVVCAVLVYDACCLDFWPSAVQCSFYSLLAERLSFNLI